jgi:hypothetical protein
VLRFAVDKIEHLSLFVDHWGYARPPKQAMRSAQKKRRAQVMPNRGCTAPLHSECRESTEYDQSVSVRASRLECPLPARDVVADGVDDGIGACHRRGTDPASRTSVRTGMMRPAVAARTRSGRGTATRTSALSWASRSTIAEPTNPEPPNTVTRRRAIFWFPLCR